MPLWQGVRGVDGNFGGSGLQPHDGGWWSPWHCHSCVGRRPDISAELAGGGILWLCGGLASAFTVARRAGADVVGRARGTADRLSLSHSQRCHLQPHAARTSRPGTRHGLGGDAVSLAHGYACGRRVCRPCWSAPWPRCIGRVCGARGSTLAPSSICYQEPTCARTDTLTPSNYCCH